jgi:hypothetical protein
MFIYTFKTPVGEAEPATKGIFCQGVDWFLDETLGVSYQVLSYSRETDMIVATCEQKPTDWVGPLFLERVEVPYRIGKRTPEGILTHHGRWSRLLWKGGRPLTRDEVRSF